MTPAYALYRRSRAHQDLSIEEQRQAVRSWAAEAGYAIVREFADDASGLDTQRRRDFLALISVCADAATRAADTVLVYDVSRFGRFDPDEAAHWEFKLRQDGVNVVYTHEPGVNDRSMSGYLVKGLKRVMAHDYSLKLSQVVSRGLRAHAALGHWTGGRPPYGFRRVVRLENGQTQPLPRGRWKAKGETVVLEIEPVAARVVESIYRWAVEHDWGHTAIAAQLNRDGVPAPESLVRQGAVAWSKDTIRAILRNPIYRGTLTYAKAQYSNIGRKRGKVFRPEAQRVVVEGAAPAIVTDALWHAAQARRQPSRFGRGRPWHREYLLSGVIRCGRCGKHYQAKKQVRGRVEAYYVCGGYLASGTAICEALSIPVEYLDEAVLDGIQKRLEQILDREWLARRLRERLIAARAAEPEAPEIAAQLAETRRRIERLVQALAAGPEELPSVRPALVGLERERAHLEARLNAALARSQANDSGLDAVIERILAFLNDIREVLAHGEPGQRKAAVRCFLEGIRIENRTRQAVLSWYRLPRLPADSVRLVELRGTELSGADEDEEPLRYGESRRAP